MPDSHTHLQLVEVGALPQPGLHHPQALGQLGALPFQGSHAGHVLLEVRRRLHVHGRLGGERSKGGGAGDDA
jgi:hypothetical protein